MEKSGIFVGVTVGSISVFIIFTVLFIIPSQTVAKIVPTLISEGEYKHPWIFT